jgi:hypothetical protein
MTSSRGRPAKLALQDGELALQQQGFRSTPGPIPTREPGRSEHPGGEQEHETQTHKRRSSRIDHKSSKLMTSIDRLVGTFTFPPA